MKELIPMDSYGIFADTHDTVRANSLQVAEYFEKKHFHVLRDIQVLDCSDDFRKSNFGFTTYVNAQGKKDKVCAMGEVSAGCAGRHQGQFFLCTRCQLAGGRCISGSHCRCIGYSTCVRAKRHGAGCTENHSAE